MALTSKQQKVLDCIHSYIDQHGYSPSVRDVCALCGFRSTSTAYDYIKRLEKQGALQKPLNKKRALSSGKPKAQDVEHVPILGTITAGMPILAVENMESSFPLPSNFVRNQEMFILKIMGDSMMNCGILDGDFVIIKKQSTAENGQIVAAMIEDEATVKRFYKEKHRIRLQPENDAYDPIYSDNATILGIVKGLFREL